MAKNLKRKPDGYWQDWDNYEPELQKVIDEIGHFPTQKELKDRKKSSIINNFRVHGGQRKVMERMGYRPKTNPRGYWQDWDNYEPEVQKVIDELGHFPTQKELKDRKKSTLAFSFRYYGGRNKVAKRMGYELQTKPDGYWKDWDNYEPELQELIDELGHFPTQKELTARKKSPIRDNFRVHGGQRKVMERMGYEPQTKPDGYWEDWDTFKSEVQELIDELGHFPTQKELTARKKGSLEKGMKINGGRRKVRERMGYEPKTKPDGYWKDWDNYEPELQEVIDELGHFPTRPELTARKKSSILNHFGVHGGRRKVMERMGYELPPEQIKTPNQFLEFIQQDSTARNLATAAIALNGNGADIEEMLISIYEGRFKDTEQVHQLLDQSRESLYEMIREGMTNLGYYVGDFTVVDKALIPVLLDQVLGSIPVEKISTSLEDKFGIILRSTYSPRFNENPDKTISELEEKAQDATNDKTKKLYQTLQTHYEKVKRLEDELG